jgi:glutathione peroxidase
MFYYQRQIDSFPLTCRETMVSTHAYNAVRRGARMLLAAAAFTGALMTLAVAGEKPATSVLGSTMKTIDGEEVTLSKYRGKVLLVVNVASECGFTPQYKDLEALYRKYKDRGFMILGFPANNFGAQEPGTDQEIKTFCSSTYGVTFDLFSKISVKGADQHALYKFITSDSTYGGDVKWNFQKYLVNREGKLAGKFFSKVTPMSDEVTSAIEKALKE